MSKENHSAGWAARAHRDPQGPAHIHLAYQEYCRHLTGSSKDQDCLVPLALEAGQKEVSVMRKELCLLTQYLSNLPTPQGPGSEQDNTCLIQSGVLLYLHTAAP